MSVGSAPPNCAKVQFQACPTHTIWAASARRRSRSVDVSFFVRSKLNIFEDISVLTVTDLAQKLRQTLHSLGSIAHSAITFWLSMVYHRDLSAQAPQTRRSCPATHLRKSSRPSGKHPSTLSASTTRPTHGRVIAGVVRLMYFPTRRPAPSRAASISPCRRPLSQSKRR